jgi:hypothetical protein
MEQLKKLYAKYQAASAICGREVEIALPHQRATMTKAFNKLTAEAAKHGDPANIVFKLTNGLI